MQSIYMQPFYVLVCKLSLANSHQFSSFDPQGFMFVTSYHCMWHILLSIYFKFFLPGAALKRLSYRWTNLVTILTLYLQITTSNVSCYSVVARQGWKTCFTFLDRKRFIGKFSVNLIKCIESIDTWTLKLWEEVISLYQAWQNVSNGFTNTNPIPNPNCENEKLCGNTTPEGRSAFTQFQVSPISTIVDITKLLSINTKKMFYIFF